jgi:hypothetical protein
MLNNNDLSSEYFRKFISNDEGKRGYVICFKGEANTTLRSFFDGLFSLVFTRRITTMSSYNEKVIYVITNNYADRINTGEIPKFPLESVRQCIFDMKKEYEEKNKKFWSQNTTSLVQSLRILQRASCYLNALEGRYINYDSSDGISKKHKNSDNSIGGALKGAFNGFFGGLLALFILWLILYIIVSIIELF